MKVLTRITTMLAHVSGIPLQDAAEGQLTSCLMMAAADFGLKVPTFYAEAERYLGPLTAPPAENIDLLTGKSKPEWGGTFQEHAAVIGLVLDKEASVWDLPNDVWAYLEGITCVSREEWKTMPKTVQTLLEAGLDCPSCKARHDVRKMIDIAEGPASTRARLAAGKTYLGKENPDTLHFVCPNCRVHFVWNVGTWETAVHEDQFGKRAGCAMALAAAVIGLAARIAR
jgi:hypothetical protein